jgi:hypothetical protein
VIVSTRVLASTIRIALLLAVVCMLGPTAGAQTATFVSRGDTALLIAKMPACTTACPDSILRTWSVYGQKYARIVPAKFTDTLKVARTSQPAVATLQYLPFRATAKASQVPALVIAWYSSAGLRLTQLAIPPGDSIRAVAFMQFADGRTSRIPSPMTWTIPPNVPAVQRVVGTMKDTLWLVAK